MNKFGGFFARRAGLYDKPADPTPNATPPTDNPLELDEELFTALGAQLGAGVPTLSWPRSGRAAVRNGQRGHPAQRRAVVER